MTFLEVLKAVGEAGFTRAELQVLHEKISNLLAKRGRGRPRKDDRQQEPEQK